MSLSDVPDRVYAAWIRAQTREFVEGITHASLDPFRGHANAIRSELPDDTVTVLDALHIVKRASTAMDEVRRRVQQATLGRRGHEQDPLYRIRRLLTTAQENLTDRGRAASKPRYRPVTPDWKSPCLARVPAAAVDVPRRHPSCGPGHR